MDMTLRDIAKQEGVTHQAAAGWVRTRHLPPPAVSRRRPQRWTSEQVAEWRRRVELLTYAADHLHLVAAAPGLDSAFASCARRGAEIVAHTRYPLEHRLVVAGSLMGVAWHRGIKPASEDLPLLHAAIKQTAHSLDEFVAGNYLLEAPCEVEILAACQIISAARAKWRCDAVR